MAVGGLVAGLMAGLRAGVAAGGRIAAGAGSRAAAAFGRRGVASLSTEGMSLGARKSQLQSLGALMSTNEVAGKLGTARPTQLQRAQVSEQAENARRAALSASLDESRRKQTSAIFATGKFTIALITAVPILERFAHHALENQRSLAMFDASIHRTFAEMDRHQLHLQAHRAGATSGTTRALGKSLMDLHTELAPAIEGLVTLANMAAIAAVGVSRLINMVITNNPYIRAILFVLQQIEDELSEDGQDFSVYYKFLKDAAEDPMNVRPGGGGD